MIGLPNSAMVHVHTRTSVLFAIASCFCLDLTFDPTAVVLPSHDRYVRTGTSSVSEYPRDRAIDNHETDVFCQQVGRTAPVRLASLASSGSVSILPYRVHAAAADVLMKQLCRSHH